MALPTPIKEIAARHLELSGAVASTSIRDVNKLLSSLAILPRQATFDQIMWGYQEIIISLVFLKVLRPKIYEKARQKRITIQDISDFYGITPNMLKRDSGVYIHAAMVLQGVWNIILGDPDQADDLFVKAFDRFGNRSAERILDNILRDFMSTFELASSGPPTPSLA